jgi:putative DNA primase/helicase
MMPPPDDDARKRHVAALIQNAPAVSASPEPEIEDAAGPSDADPTGVDRAVVEYCATLDASDTDNAERLIVHFGEDLAVMAQEGVTGGDWLAWAGTHWDLAGGPARARIIAQKLGGRIGLEAEFLRMTPDEARAVKAIEGLPNYATLADVPANDKPLFEAAKRAREALDKRKARRRAFGVTAKNKGRMDAFLDCAAPRLRRSPESFNADRLAVATLTHTLRFVREPDPECPDPESVRWTARLDAREGHERADWITAVVPQPWLPDAPAARWLAFLEAMLPDAEKRRTVQQFAGLGLLALPVQYLMFHYGTGANGKSVFLEVLTRVLGPGLAVGLPRESIVGAGDRSAGAASPDLARVYGKRMLRILEVTADQPLQADLVKKITGGESFPVRTLFKGFFEFQNFASAHMSGNGKPTIDGGDYGTMRRLLVVHWDQTVPEEERRDFEEMVGELVATEGPGILAWLARGALDYLANGLVIAPAVRAATQDYGDEMNPVGEFARACVRTMPGQRVGAGEMFEAYKNWSAANAKREKSQAKFGREVSKLFTKTESYGRIYYLDCILTDVPEPPRSPDRAGRQA